MCLLKKNKKLKHEQRHLACGDLPRLEKVHDPGKVLADLVVQRLRSRRGDHVDVRRAEVQRAREAVRPREEHLRTAIEQGSRRAQSKLSLPYFEKLFVGKKWTS